MRRLILLRHGKTEAMAASGDDFDRALLPRGQADAALMAKVLLEEGLRPDLALVSAAVRARQTWEVAKSVFGDVKTEIVPTLYLAPSERMRDLIDEWGERADTLIMVGHNPGIHELAVALLREGSASASQIAKLQQALGETRLHGIASQHGAGFIKLNMGGRATTTQFVVVHARQIVVNQRISVDQLDSRRRSKRGLAGFFGRSCVTEINRFSRRQHQQRAQTLTAIQHGITHGLAQNRG